MKTLLQAPDQESRRWELSTLQYVYPTLFAAACFTAFVMYRAATIIQDSSTTINSKSYFMTHFLTLVFEVVLWFIITKAAVRMKSYTLNVIRSSDGQALNDIANALLLSLLYAVSFGMASTVKTLYWHTNYLHIVTTVTNLVPVAVVLVASILLFRGSWRLTKVCHVVFRPVYIPILIAFIAVVFGYVMYFYHVAPKIVDDDGLPHFAVSARLLLGIYVLPYVVVWLLGFIACLNLSTYACHVKGVLYKTLFQKLYEGLTMIVTGVYLIQIFYVSNVSSNKLGMGLIFILVLLLLLIGGSMMIYRGVNQLYSLER